MFFGSLIRQIMERQDTRAHEEVAFLRTRVVALEDCILGMKHQGFELEPTEMGASFQRDLLSDVIMGAIESRSKQGTTLHADLLDYARAQSVAGQDEEEIADNIMGGSSMSEFD